MASYECSNGKRLNKSVIDARTRKAKEEKLSQMRDDFGFVFCEDCGNNGSNTYLDCSHNVSVKEAQESGRAELAFDVNNIKIRCRRCHQKRDGLNIQNPKN